MPICARNITTLRFFNHAFIVSIIFPIAAKMLLMCTKLVLFCHIYKLFSTSNAPCFDENANILVMQQQT